MKKITLKLNGETREAYVEYNDTLLEALRDKFGIKSPKCGCDRGDCGACTILLNGKSVRSCLILAIEADEQEIETVEGLTSANLCNLKDYTELEACGCFPAAEPVNISEIQKAFLKHNSFQCGFCAPGIVMSATELFRKNPTPSLDEIKEALSGNLCRCTGYLPIFEALVEVSEKGGNK